MAMTTIYDDYIWDYWNDDRTLSFSGGSLNPLPLVKSHITGYGFLNAGYANGVIETLTFYGQGAVSIELTSEDVYYEDDDGYGYVISYGDMTNGDMYLELYEKGTNTLVASKSFTGPYPGGYYDGPDSVSATVTVPRAGTFDIKIRVNQMYAFCDMMDEYDEYNITSGNVNYIAPSFSLYMLADTTMPSFESGKIATVSMCRMVKPDAFMGVSLEKSFTTSVSSTDYQAQVTHSSSTSSTRKIYPLGQNKFIRIGTFTSGDGYSSMGSFDTPPEINLSFNVRLELVSSTYSVGSYTKCTSSTARIGITQSSIIPTTTSQFIASISMPAWPEWPTSSYLTTVEEAYILFNGGTGTDYAIWFYTGDYYVQSPKNMNGSNITSSFTTKTKIVCGGNAYTYVTYNPSPTLPADKAVTYSEVKTDGHFDHIGCQCPTCGIVSDYKSTKCTSCKTSFSSCDNKCVKYEYLE